MWLTIYGQAYMMQKDEFKGDNKLRAYREMVGKTQLQVAIDVGVNPQAVGKWEQGVIPHLDKAVLLAQSLEITMEQLCVAFGLNTTKESP